MPAQRPLTAIPKHWPVQDPKAYKPLDWFIPYDKNPRTHPAEQIELLGALIAAHGPDQPIVVDEDRVILKGHGRLSAARAKGLEVFTFVQHRGLSATDKTAMRISDNQVSLLSGWNTALIQGEIGSLKTSGYDIALLGFPEAQLRGWGVPIGTESAQDAEFAPSPPVNPIVQAGDLWILDRHRLMCGNSLKDGDVDRLLNGAVPDLANCDPPYGVSIVKAAAVGGRKPFGSKNLGRGHGLGQAGFGRVPVNAAKAIIETGVYAPIIGDDTTDTAVANYKILKRIGVPTLVLWGGNYYANMLPPSRCWFVWDKKVTGTFADVELAWTNCNQVARLFHHEWNGLMKASERGERRVHPTQKPVALSEWVIETAAPKAKSVIDLFVGSGSCLIACERYNKTIRFFGMEMAPAYVQVAIERWQTFVGKEAVLEATGKTFAAVKAEREKPPRKPRAVRAPAAQEA